MRTTTEQVLNTIQESVTIQLRIPGPTPCPPEALEASGRQMMNHRGKGFFALTKRVTAVKPGDAYDAATIVKLMRENHGIVLAGGQRRLHGKTFRIGHLGYVSVDEQVMAALANVLPRARQGG